MKDLHLFSLAPLAPARRSCALCALAVHSLALLWLAGGAQAQIRTDASLGQAAKTLSGPNYAIPQTLGKLSGNNLFHSFQTFNLAVGEAANFSTTSPGIANVISRVTGGDMSQINGTVRLTAASGAPAFFFINPAGIAFGAGASVDVPGALHVSTANSVKFADGRFNADLGLGSTLSSAAPEAFGFLGSSRASIAVQDSAIVQPKIGFPISVVAGDVAIVGGGVLGARTGAVRVVAVGKMVSDIAVAGPVPPVQGDVRISNEGTILAVNRGDLPPGTVSVHAGHVAVTDAGNITSTNTGRGDAADMLIESNTASLRGGGYLYSKVTEGGSGKGANIDLKIAQGLSLGQDASISTETYAAGQAGQVRVQAGQVVVDSAAYIASKSLEGGGGAAGNVTVLAKDTIAVSGAFSSIHASTASPGAAGEVQLAATDIVLSKGANVYSLSSQGNASAGNVALNAGNSIVLTGVSTVISTSAGSGNSGNVQLSASSISLDGNSFISTGTTTRGGRGKAGSVVLNAGGSLDVSNNSFINSGTASDGDAGSITIRARDVNLDNGRITSFADIGAGNGGSIDVVATGRVSLINDGSILSNSFSLGNAGSVSITSAALSLQSGASVGSKSLGNAPGSGEVVAGGNAGDIRITTLGALAIQGGSISSGTSTSGQGGSVDVSASRISLDGVASHIDAAATAGSTGKAGSLTLRAADTFLLANGAFITTGNFAQVSPATGLQTSVLSITAPRVRVVSGAFVSAEATGLMSAGNINVMADELSLGSGVISTKASQGNGGGISVRGGVVSLAKSQITTSVLGELIATGGVAGFGNGGDIRVHANALILNSGFIQANTQVKSASGGRVDLDVNTLVASGNSAFVGGQSTYSFAPEVFGFNVIQAAAPLGLSGTIQVTSPVLDLSGSLGRLNAHVADAAPLGRSPCQTTGGSSLALVGQGTLPVSYQGLMGAVPGRPAVAMPSGVPSAAGKPLVLQQWLTGALGLDTSVNQLAPHTPTHCE